MSVAAAVIPAFTSAAIQAAIDSARGGPIPANLLTSPPTGPALPNAIATASVHLPAGRYIITEPLRVWGFTGFKLTGDGPSTFLDCTGLVGDCVLDINGVFGCTFEGFLIRGNDVETLTYGVHYHWDQATSSRSSSANTFRKITVQNVRCVTAWRVGTTGDNGNQVDTTAYYDILVNGQFNGTQTDFYQYGVWFGSDTFSNDLIHNWYNLSSVGYRNGVFAQCTAGAIWGGDFGSNNVDVLNGSLSYFSVQGVRSENSARFYRDNFGASNAVGNVSISDVQMSGTQIAADGFVIDSSLNGCLHVKNFSVASGPANASVRYTPYLPSNLYIDGFTSQSTAQVFASNLQYNVNVASFSHTYIPPAGPPVTTCELRRLVTAATAVQGGDRYLDVDCSAGSFPITFGAASKVPAGRWCEIQNVGKNGSPSFSLQPGDTIPNPFSLASRWKAVRFRSDGVNQWIASQAN